MAADYACQTISPDDPDGPRVDAIFPADFTLRLYKYAPVQYNNLIVARQVLLSPLRIFYGIREYNQGGWCYTGRPAEWYVRENTVVPFPASLVFAVYLNPNMRVYECRAERADPDDTCNPVDWRNRYRGLIWKSTS